MSSRDRLLARAPVPPHGVADDGAGTVAPSRGFLAATALLAGAIVALCIGLARREFFFGDDFIFLRLAQEPRDWLQIFLPFRHRVWWSYRPLSIEVFFSTMGRLVGLTAFPYLLSSIVLHGATSALVWRLARQLGIERRAAIAAAVLSLGMYPSLNGELFWVSAFQTVSGCFFYVLALTAFADHARDRGGAIALVIACASLVLGLVCNELVVTLPGPAVLLAWSFADGSAVARARAALRRSAPLIAIVLLYVPFRYLLIARPDFPMPAVNAPQLGWHVIANFVLLLRYLTKVDTPLATLYAAVVVAGWAVVLRAGADAPARLARQAGVTGGWLVCTMVPFLAAGLVPHRAAMVMEAPFCVLLGAHLDPLVRGAARAGRGRVAEAGLVALLLVAFPYAVVREQAAAPRGAMNRELLGLLRDEGARLPFGACVRLVPAPDESWTATELYAARFRATGLLAVSYPGLHLELPGPPDQPQVWRTDCAAVFAVELRHGAPSVRPTFALRRVPAAG